MSNTSGEDGRETVFWYAMCAYKKEMYAQKELEKEHIECFVPLCYTIKEYHGRKERVLAPAISNLVFVHTTKSVDVYKRQILACTPAGYVSQSWA